ncbi:MAG TPA: SDR family oxidoreductase [Bryobacteraceae bacterium]|nr:SDR family oxidoreductase [Bryobacteraceae bacterium]
MTIRGRLARKTAIVTGASRGIGRSIALRLASEGANVAICARDRDALLEAAREIEAQGVRVAAIPLDLRLAESADRLVRETYEAFEKIDILVNNAGATKRGEFLELTEEDWTDGFALKFFGAVRVTRCAWPHIREQSGSVLNIVGVGGRTPGAQFAIGGSVNAALLSFTKAMADVGIRDGVQVNAINPGSVRTSRFARMVQQLAEKENIDAREAEAEIVRRAKTTRIGDPADIANLALFILSPEGRFLQGALIDMDGGQTKTI